MNKQITAKANLTACLAEAFGVARARLAEAFGVAQVVSGFTNKELAILNF